MRSRCCSLLRDLAPVAAALALLLAARLLPAGRPAPVPPLRGCGLHGPLLALVPLPELPLQLLPLPVCLPEAPLQLCVLAPGGLQALVLPVRALLAGCQRGCQRGRVDVRLLSAVRRSWVPPCQPVGNPLAVLLLTLEVVGEVVAEKLLEVRLAGFVAELFRCLLRSVSHSPVVRLELDPGRVVNGVGALAERGIGVDGGWAFTGAAGGAAGAASAAGAAAACVWARGFGSGGRLAKHKLGR